MKTRNILLELIVFVYILLFVYTAASKWLDLKTFADQINNQPFDNRLTPFLVWGLPAVEICIVVLLAISRTRLYGLLSASLLMTAFTVYVALVIFGFYARTPCSCGGLISSLTWSQHLLFNILFIILGIVGSFLEWKSKREVLPFRAVS